MSLSTTTSLVVSNGSNIQEGTLLLIDGTEERTAGVVTDVSTVDTHDIFGDGSAEATYQLNGNVTDLGGTYNGTATNVTYGTGKFGQGGVFNSSTSWISSNYEPTINDLGSISAHIKISSEKVYQTIFSAGETHPSNPVAYPYYTWCTFLVTGNILRATYLHAGGAQTNIVSSIPLEVGVEYHVVANLSKNAVDATDFDIYINGVKDVSAIRTNGVSIDPQVGTCGIGRNSGSQSSTTYFDGTIDQVRIFNRALTQAEVTSLYNEEYKTVAISPALSVVPTSAKIVSAYTDITPDTWFYKPTDNDEVGGSSIRIEAAKLPFTNGRNASGGYNVLTSDYTGNIDFSTCPDGIHYVAVDSNLSPKFYKDVSIGLYEKTSADDNRLVFDTESGKWFTTTGGELVANGTFDSDTSGWTAGTPGTVAVINGAMRITVNGTGYPIMWYDLTGLEIGKEYKVSVEMYSNSTTVTVPLLNIFYSDKATSLGGAATTGFGIQTFTFIAPATEMLIRAMCQATTNGIWASFDNISVYKVEATLGTELPNPICFIDDKPYQVTSGTPMDRLVDYPSIPKNVMESTYVDGMLVTTGNRKVIELGTIFNNNRYVVDNPFGNDRYMDCDVKVEVFYNGVWNETGWYSDGAANSAGTSSGSTLEGIVIVTGKTQVCTSYNIAGGTGSFIASVVSAPARVIVTYVGVSK